MYLIIISVTLLYLIFKYSSYADIRFIGFITIGSFIILACISFSMYIRRLVRARVKLLSKVNYLHFIGLINLIMFVIFEYSDKVLIDSMCTYGYYVLKTPIDYSTISSSYLIPNTIVTIINSFGLFIESLGTILFSGNAELINSLLRQWISNNSDSFLQLLLSIVLLASSAICLWYSRYCLLEEEKGIKKKCYY